MSLLHDSSGDGILSGNPRTMFLFGLFTGIAAMTTIALIVVLSLLIGGRTFAKSTDTGAGQVAQVPSPQPAPGQQQQPTPSAPVKPVDEKNEPIRGPKNAKVTLIEYSDYECPFCLRHEATIVQAMKEYPKDVRVVYRNYPLSFHPQAQKAAEAAECAGAQGKFWEMHDKIFEANKVNAMSVQRWKDDAKALGLNTDAFNKCLDSGAMAAKIAQQESEGAAAGVQGTPGTFVNGVLIEGAVPYAQIKQAIDAALKK